MSALFPLNRPLEERLRAIEDRLEIYHLICTYGVSVDGLLYDDLPNMWTEDGVITSANIGTYQGTAEDPAIKQLLRTDHSQWVYDEGGAHVLSTPYIHVEGDRAVATVHGRLYLRDEEGDRHIVYRVIVTRWELVRTEPGWRVKRRINELFTKENSAAKARKLAAARALIELPTGFELPTGTARIWGEKESQLGR